MDDFVKEQLLRCNCENYIDIFKENEIDETTFRKLTLADLREILPGKVGVQKKIVDAIENLGKPPDVVALEKLVKPGEVNPNEATEAVIAVEKKQDNAEPQAEEDKKKQDTAEPQTEEDEKKHLLSLLHGFTLSPAMGKKIEEMPKKVTENKETSKKVPHSLPPPRKPALQKNESKSKAYEDMMNVMSMLDNYKLPNNAAEKAGDKAGASKSYKPASNSNDSAPISSYGPAEPPRIIVSQRFLKRKQRLPIFSMQQRFVEDMRNNQVMIVVGETGSGKSTQLTQYLYEAGFGTCGKIGCTQPRKVAAKALAKRVSEEVGTELGDRVGYRIRFDNRAANNTSIIYMTDGILLQELAQEPLVYSYACIMLDEAHERSMNTDVLLGLLKMTIRRRPDLKLLITSATLDARKFSKYFGGAPIFEIPGRPYPVDIEYVGRPEPDPANLCVSTVMRIHRFEKEGDILVFLGGQADIERCCELILTRDERQELWVLPCYGDMSLEYQNKVFEPAPDGYKRKVVVATNIAETSITIDGIVYVVDSGYVKQSEYDPHKKITTLNHVQITQAQAIQRAGRAGRTRPGKCFRLYTKETFDSMPKAPVPEIVRSNLDSTVLMLAAHGVEDISQFDFMDPPPRAMIDASVAELMDLEALDSQCRLTRMGREISRFPLEPKLSKVLIMSVDLRCTEEMLTITSLLSVVQSAKIFHRPKKYQFLADKAKESFFKPEGDLHTYLNAFTQWEKENYSEDWCRKNFVNRKALDEALAIREQLENVMESNNYKITPSFLALPDPQAVQKCIASGYFSQIAFKSPRGHGYVTFANPDFREQVYIHPSSALFKSIPRWVIYEEVMNTGSKSFLINVTAIEPRWIREYAPRFFEKLQSVFPDAAFF